MDQLAARRHVVDKRTARVVCGRFRDNREGENILTLYSSDENRVHHTVEYRLNRADGASIGLMELISASESPPQASSVKTRVLTPQARTEPGHFHCRCTRHALLLEAKGTFEGGADGTGLVRGRESARGRVRPVGPADLGVQGGPPVGLSRVGFGFGGASCLHGRELRQQHQPFVPARVYKFSGRQQRKRLAFLLVQQQCAPCHSLHNCRRVVRVAT
jgi:hypothetical protein